MSKKRPSKRIPRYEREEINYYEENKNNGEKTNMNLNTLNMLSTKHIELTKNQKELFQMILDNKITVATGPAGTAKSFVACYSALSCLKKTEYDNIILTKPTEVIGGTELGFLPGSLDEKTAVFLDSFIGVFADMLEGKKLQFLMDSKVIEFRPAQFMRGKTFKNSIIVVDEFQNFDIKTLMAIVTRLGDNCKMIFVGDMHQNDISQKYVAVNLFKQILDGVKGADQFEFSKDDIVRDQILIDITENYERLKAQGSLTQNKRNT